jgi:MFS transporter, PHS family, inorganic phosphate transporter
VRGETEDAARQIALFSEGELSVSVLGKTSTGRMGLRQFLTNRRMLRLLLGTAASWFLLDYAFYGNTLSVPAILKDVDPGAGLTAKLAWTLGIFVVFALPGYVLAFTKMDRIGHRRLQLIGFGVMGGAFLALGLVPALTTTLVPFLLVFGLSYFFIQFGPNTTTFVLPSEVFPVSMRTTGHGIAAGVGKLGAFIGVFLVPVLDKSIGLRGMLLVAAGSAGLGYLVTLLLPETAGRTLENISSENPSDVRPGPTTMSTLVLSAEPGALVTVEPSL